MQKYFSFVSAVAIVFVLAAVGICGSLGSTNSNLGGGRIAGNLESTNEPDGFSDFYIEFAFRLRGAPVSDVTLRVIDSGEVSAAGARQMRIMTCFFPNPTSRN
jgi:hypothetical protein